MTAVTPGTSLGPYTILSTIGEGGMGRVYRARDARLGRDVAIKVSHEAFSDRFEREARAAAALNHPNIGQIYDVGPDYLVMELVEGAPIAPTDDLRRLLDLAIQIADGLAAAHAAGLVHRDLKPDNILVTGPATAHPQRVKILDFGLATAATMCDSDVTRMTRRTEPGTIVGTVSYMSPEQARGDVHLTLQSDQFSFGLILYELVTGTRAFQRPSAAETMAAIIRDDPEPLPAAALQPLRWVIERLLSKDPADRYDSTRDLHRELRQIRARLSETTTTAMVALNEPRQRRPLPRMSAVVLFILGGLTALLGIQLALRRLPPGTDLAALTVTPFSRFDVEERAPAWSPDGRTIAFSMAVQGTWQVFTRAVDGQDTAQLTQEPARSVVMFWSADGSTIYYLANGELRAVGASGGPSQSVLKDVQAAALHPDGRTLAFARGGRLFADVLGGNNPRQVGDAPFPQGQVGRPVFSRDGSRLAVDSSGQTWILPFPAGTPHPLPFYDKVTWFPDNQHLLAIAVPSSTLELQLVRVDAGSGAAETVYRSFGMGTELALSPDGRRLALARGETGWNVLDVSIPSGLVRPVLSGSGVVSWLPDWAPSGNRYVVSTNRTGPIAIEDVSAQDGFSRRLATAQADELVAYPRWSPDGSRVAYNVVSNTDVTRLMVTNVAGGRATPFGTPTAGMTALSWSPDSQWVCYVSRTEQAVVKVQVAASATPVALAKWARSDVEWLDYPMAAWSPAGDWIAYPARDGLRLISPDGKTNRLLSPRRLRVFGFARDGRRVYGVVHNADGNAQPWELFEIDVSTGRDRSMVRLQLPEGTQSLAGFSLHPDGTHFLTSRPVWPYDIWLIDGFDRPRRSLRWLLGH